MHNNLLLICLLILPHLNAYGLYDTKVVTFQATIYGHDEKYFFVKANKKKIKILKDEKIIYHHKNSKQVTIQMNYSDFKFSTSRGSN